jgi:RNA polymerase sigma factor (sigma-70 family)
MHPASKAAPQAPLTELGARDLIERCRSHDCSASWHEFLVRYGWSLAATVRRALGRVGLAARPELQEDLLQETYCRLLADDRRRLGNCRGEDDRAVAGYLCRIAENVVRDHLRRRKATKRGRELLRAAPAVGPGALDCAPDPEARTDRRAMVAESRRIYLAHGAAALTGPNRRRDLWVTYLALFEGWSSQEIADRLGSITANNVDSVVYRTRRRLAAVGLELADERRRRQRSTRSAVS